MSGFSCERAASSVLESRALSSAYIVLCGAWCLDPGTHVLSFGLCRGSNTLALHFLSLCECAVSGTLETAHSCPRVFCCVARSSCFYRLRAFVISCAVWYAACIFIGCVLSCCHVL